MEEGGLLGLFKGFLRLNKLKIIAGILFFAGSITAISANSHTVQTSLETQNFSLMMGVFMLLVMFLVITLVATEKVHRTLVVFFIACALIFMTYTFGQLNPALQLLPLERAFASIDGQVIGLLLGMMIIVGVVSQTHLFQWMAYKLFVFSKGSLRFIFFAFIIITAVLSAFLDNVTTVFLIVPVAITIAKIFDINPLALVIPLILASNIGGTATLIGDPPNIMIGSYADLSFNEFIINLGFPVLIILAIVSVTLYIIYKTSLSKGKKIKKFDALVKEMKKDYKIKHKKLLIASLIVLGLVIIFFFLHGAFHMPAAVPALMGAALLMLIRDRLIRMKFGRDRERMEEAIHNTFAYDVEWLVIGFFIFLFMIVGALEHTGILNVIAEMIQQNFGENLLLCALVILWISAIFSAFLDNIPFTAVMLPVVASLIHHYTGLGMDAHFLWWSLAFGACLGGNGTLIGASANIVAVGLLKKEGTTLSFGKYFKVAFPLMIIQVALASIAVWVMYHLA